MKEKCTHIRNTRNERERKVSVCMWRVERKQQGMESGRDRGQVMEASLDRCAAVLQDLAPRDCARAACLSRARLEAISGS